MLTGPARWRIGGAPCRLTRREKADRQTPAIRLVDPLCRNELRLRSDTLSLEGESVPSPQPLTNPTPKKEEMEMQNITNRLRDQRENRALMRLKIIGVASALELGRAAIAGEERASKIPLSGQESIGLSIGLELVRRKCALPTRNNQFRVVRRAKGTASSEVSLPPPGAGQISRIF